MRPLRHLRAPGYFVAALVTLFPIFDFFVTVWPIQAGNVRWRVAAAGQFAASVMTILMGLLIALAISFVLDHPRMQRAIAAVGALFAASLVVLLALFTLDWVQLRGDVRPEVRHAFDVVSAQAGIKLILGIIGASLIAVGAYRAAREAMVGAKRGGAARAQEGSPLVAGVSGRGAQAAT